MALHPVKLPKKACDLRRIVAMQKLLLKALCANPMNSGMIDETWLRGVWNTQDPGWIKKFCRKRKYSILEPIGEIANASSAVREEIYEEFCHQNRVKKRFDAGGQFRKLVDLAGVTAEVAGQVHRVFTRFYHFLSHETAANWNGYEFPQDRAIKNQSYKDSLWDSNRPEMSVCPYCDGANFEPELDHYYSKETFPFLSCSPWNLVPACHLCNKIMAKGNRIALTLGVPEPSEGWLHPFLRPASTQVQIKLTGNPQNSIPELHSPDPAEQIRLNNHTGLIRTLEKRWTNAASVHFDILVREVNRKVDALNSVDSLIKTKLDDHLASRGRDASSMVHAAVCHAVLELRPEYIEEFTTPNAPALE